MRLITDGERERFVRSVMVPFLDPACEENAGTIAHYAGITEVDRAWVVEDRGRFVANCAVRTMDVTVPGGAVIPMGGVTAVGVHPTHRRRGILRHMMAGMLADARQRGEPVAGLLASESSIYRRFGFGHATDGQTLRIRSDRSAFVEAAPAMDLDLLEHDEALEVIPGLFDRCRRTRGGEPNRPEARWDWMLRDPAANRDGGKGAFVAAGTDGFVRYRMAANEDDLVVEDLMGATPEAEAALWRFVLDVDLVQHVVAKRRPVDEPVRWRLADPRRLEVQHVEDELHLRILDVPAALTARRYDAPGRLVLDLEQSQVPDGEFPGRWALEVGSAGATCRATDEPADLVLGIADLGSVYLGGFRPSVLAAAGRIRELIPGALGAADILFAVPLAPRTSTGF